jgi:formamidopyrimidine-DNA glycosylase
LREELPIQAAPGGKRPTPTGCLPMPELPEVETVRRGLRRVMEGQVIERVEQRRADLRFPLPQFFAQRLAGRRVIAMTRRAKYLLADLDDAQVLLMHLGMSGRFSVTENGETAVPGAFGLPQRLQHEHVVFHMSGGARVGYSDPRRFGVMDLARAEDIAAHRLLAGLGPEPLGAEFSAASLHESLAGKRTSIKAALLDQRLVAGLGNIYVNEALFRARIAPSRSAHTLARSRRPGEPLIRLTDAIKSVLREAIDAGGSSLRDHAQTDGSLGYFQHTFAVYDRAGARCTRFGCGGTIARAVQSGRSTFWCPHCQC